MSRQEDPINIIGKWFKNKRHKDGLVEPYEYMRPGPQDNTYIYKCRYHTGSVVMTDIDYGWWFPDPDCFEQLEM